MQHPVKTAPSVSIIIPTYNRRQVLAHTITSLFSQSFPADRYEIVVVVDGSTDGTVEMLRQLQPPCALQIIEQSNCGQGIARNAGAKAACGELLLFLDDDFICDPDLLRAHYSAHKDADPIIVCGRFLVSDESAQTLGTARIREWVKNWEAYVSTAAEIYTWPNNLCFGPNVSIPREIFLLSGGYDNRLSHYSEDIELALRLWKMGIRFLYQPLAVVHEIHTRTALDFLRTDAVFKGRHTVLLCRKHPEMRPYQLASRIGSGAAWKRLSRRIIAQFPFSPEIPVRPLLQFLERFCRFSLLRLTGLRLLMVCSYIVSLRSMVEEAGGWNSLCREFGKSLPVLRYQAVSVSDMNDNPHKAIASVHIEKHIEWLAHHGYTGIRPSDWLAWCRTGKALPDKPIIIILDGHCTELTEQVLPVLERYGFGAALFPASADAASALNEIRRFGSNPAIAAGQMRQGEMPGIEFGVSASAGQNSISTADYSPGDKIIHRRESIEKISGNEVVSLLWSGEVIPDIVRQKLSEKFHLAFISQAGLNTLSTDLFRLRCLTVSADAGLMEFAFQVHFGSILPDRFRGWSVRAGRFFYSQDKAHCTEQ